MRVGAKRETARSVLLIASLLVGGAFLTSILPRSFEQLLKSDAGREGRDELLPRLELTIPIRNLMLLDGIRGESLERGLLFRSANDMVSALLAEGGRREKVRIRLKGDWVDHFGTDKWSWRVHVLGDGHILGLRRFSLQSPDTRWFQREAEFFHHLRAEGVLAPRYEFVDLWLNGLHVGVMALEEHFSKELLEAQGRREGVIVRFDEDDFWRDRERNDAILGVGQVLPHQDLSWRSVRVRPFREKVIRQSAVLERQAATAVGMLRAVQSNAVEPSVVFDVEATGRFLALHDFWGYWHGLRWHNFRFYLNPFTLKLEPIAFDATSDGIRPEFVYRDRSLVFVRVLLADDAIYAAYRRYLERFMDRSYVDETMAELRRLEDRLVAQLRTEYREISADAEARVLRRMETLHSRGFSIPSQEEIVATAITGREGRPVESDLPYVAVVYAHVIAQQGDTAVLELATGLKEDVRITEITVGAGMAALPLEGLTDLKLPIRLRASYFDRKPHYVRVRLPRELAGAADRLFGKAVVASHPNRIYEFTAVDYLPIVRGAALPERASVEEVLARHPFLRWDGETFSIPSGEWLVDEPLIIPRQLALASGGAAFEQPGLRLVRGTRLRFGEDAFLLTYGAIEARGAREQPIILSGREGEPWKGVVVLGADRGTLLEHLRIEDTGATEDGAWQLTGGVTFYETDVTLTKVVFNRTHAEDALNIVRSSFLLSDVEISASRSDGLDSDFSTGTLQDCAFRDIGGDAIDLSGSRVSARRILLARVRDKGVSVGEKSVFEASDMQVSDAGTAIVSKDLSRAEIDGITLRDLGFAAFMSYNKKPEYGPGTLEVSRADFDDSATLAIAQRGSSLQVDGNSVAETDLDVDSLYSLGIMRK